jgi:biopolymer transport protein ExbB
MEHVSLIKIFTSFAMLGAEWVMWVLVALSILSIAVAIDLVLYHRSMRDDLAKLADDVNRRLRENDVDGAVLRLQQSASPAALVATAGLYEASRGAEACEHVMQSTLARVKPKLERNLTLLATIGNNAPFIGLFGTVIGIIQAFDALKPPAVAHGAAAQAAAAAAAQAASGKVMGTIAEALVATAIGLLVAIPAVGAYNYFQRKVKLLLAATESLAQVVMAYARGEGGHGESTGLTQLISLMREDREEQRMIVIDDEGEPLRTNGKSPSRAPLEVAN